VACAVSADMLLPPEPAVTVTTTAAQQDNVSEVSAALIARNSKPCACLNLYITKFGSSLGQCWSFVSRIPVTIYWTIAWPWCMPCRGTVAAT